MTVLALFIRLAFILIAGNPEKPAMYEHGETAHNLYTGHGFAMNWPYTSADPQRAALLKQPPQFEGAFLPPLNPYIIYGAYLLFGENSGAIIFLMILYAIVSSFIPIFVFKTSLLIGPEKSARISSLISSLFLPGAFAVTTFSGSPLYQLLGVIVLYLAILSAQKPSFRNFAWLGVSCGIMTMLRSEFFFLGFILIAAAIFFAFRKSASTKVLTQGLISLVLCACIIAPWTYRNYRLFHAFIPVLSHPWLEIWRGNNSNATGTTLDEEGHPTWATPEKNPDLIRRMDSIPYDQNYETQVDRIFKEEALSFIRKNPGRFFFLGFKKVAYLFTIDFSHPSSRNPLYVGSMIIVSVLTVIGLYQLFRDKHSYAFASGVIVSVFFLAYIGMTFLTVMLPRYQIYVFTAGMGVTGLITQKTHSSAPEKGLII